VSPGPQVRAAAGANGDEPPARVHASVEHDGLIHQDIELSEELIDIL
jgi:hypothetical protein